jgi:hypothetical protein
MAHLDTGWEEDYRRAVAERLRVLPKEVEPISPAEASAAVAGGVGAQVAAALRSPTALFFVTFWRVRGGVYFDDVSQDAPPSPLLEARWSAERGLHRA